MGESIAERVMLRHALVVNPVPECLKATALPGLAINIHVRAGAIVTRFVECSPRFAPRLSDGMMGTEHSGS